LRANTEGSPAPAQRPVGHLPRGENGGREKRPFCQGRSAVKTLMAYREKDAGKSDRAGNDGERGLFRDLLLLGGLVMDSGV
jgi:hypothetical protein